jgi:hypothetical protein
MLSALHTFTCPSPISLYTPPKAGKHSYMNHRFKTESARNPFLCLAVTLAAAFVARPARAANLTLQGSFANEDDVELFNVAVGSNSLIKIRSYGYASGATASGAIVPGCDEPTTRAMAAGDFNLCGYGELVLNR